MKCLTNLRLFIAALSLMLHSNAYCQNLWLYREGGIANEESLDIAISPASDLYYCGYYNGSITFQNQLISAAGFNDIFIAKRTNSGNNAWVKTAGGVMPDRAFACVSDANSNVVVTGYFTDVATFNAINLNANNQSQDVFVAKYSTTGNLTWALQLGGEFEDVGYGIDTDALGNIYVTGQFKGHGLFGPYAVTSSLDPTSTFYSSDIFICKIDANGNVLWVKTGSATGEDTGKDISCDNAGHVYVTGVFSNDITFDQFYPNAVLNMGFVLKLDDAGNEQWLQTVYSNYIQCEEVETTTNGVLLTGNYSGQMTLGSDPFVVNSSYDYNNFVLKLAENSSLSWFSDDGSDNALQIKSMDTDQSGNVYVAGSFVCDFTEYNQELGGSLFYSAGNKDVYVVKYTSTGSREWMKQYGGPGDELIYGIATESDNEVFVSGGFESWLNIPVAFGVSLPGCINTGMYSANGNSSACGYQHYGAYQGLLAIAGRDIFIASPVDLSAPPYDFAAHADLNVCDDVLPFCIEQCLDTISECIVPGTQAYLAIESQPGSDPEQIIGPTYLGNWSSNAGCQSGDINASEMFQMCVSEEGWLWMTISREDGCGVSETDSIYVDFLDTPPIPVLSDALGVIVESNSPEDFLMLCEVGDVFTPQILPDYTYSWSGDGVVSNNELSVNSDGTALLTATSANGCTSTHQVHFDLSNQPPYLDNPGDVVLTGPQGQIISDTLEICPSNPIDVSFIFDDTNDSSQDDVYSYWYTDIQIGNTHVLSDTTTITSNHNFHVYATQDGLYTIYGWLNYQANSCDYVMDSVQLYVDVQDNQDYHVDLTGPTAICPGDTITLTANATAGMSVVFTGTQILGSTADQIFETTMPGLYTAVASITTPLGCFIQDFDQQYVASTSPPLVFSNPADGVICPGQVATLTAQTGMAYTWIGPAGNIVGSSQSIQVSESGYYYCLQTNNNGCELGSAFIEITEYTSPYITAAPTNYLCTDQPVSIHIEASSAALYNWLSPLTGTQATMQVSTPGIYSAQVSACGITDTISIEIFDSPVDTEYLISAPQHFCAGDTITLQPSDSSLLCVWHPSMSTDSILIVTEPGTYYAVFTDLEGCVGETEELTFDYESIDAPSVNSTIVCSGTSAQLSASSDYTVSWFDENFQLLGQGNTFQTGNLFNEETFYVSAQVDECVSTLTEVQVSIFPLVEFEILPEDNCPHQNISFNITSGQVIQPQWDFDDGQTSNASNTQYAYEDAGIYDVVLTGFTLDGCPVDVAHQVTIHPQPQALFNPDALHGCSGVGIQISNNSIDAISSQWYHNSVYYSNEWEPIFDLENFTCDPVSAELKLLVTSDFNCKDTALTSLEIWPSPIADFSLVENQSCTPNNAIQVNHPTSCDADPAWLVNDQLQSALWSPILEATGVGENIITLRMSNFWGCVDSLSQSFSFFQKPDVLFLSENTEGCGEVMPELQGLNDGIVHWNWIFSDGQTSNVMTPDLTFTDTGSIDLTLMVEDDNGCRDTLFMEDVIHVFGLPNADFTYTPYPANINDPEITFTAFPDSTIISWHWDFGDNFFGEGQEVTHEFLLARNELVKLWVTNSEGCNATVSHPVYFEGVPEVYVPNAFTPGDANNINDQFRVVFSHVEMLDAFHFSIFNRWGEKIFESDDPLVPWIGNTQNGEYFCPDAVYDWQLKYSVKNDPEMNELNGHVTLIR